MCLSLSSLFPHLNYDSTGQKYFLIHISVKCTIRALDTKLWWWAHQSLFGSGLVCSVVRGQYLVVQTKGGRGNTLLPAVSSLTLHFLPIHTLTGTAAITAWRLQTHKIGLISQTKPASQTCPVRWLFSAIWTVWGSPDLELCDCELNIQEFPFQLLLPPSPFKHNAQPEPKATFSLRQPKCTLDVTRILTKMGKCLLATSTTSFV